jgi:hypothetical protein
VAEIWTDITTEDNPGSGGEAVEKGRVYRDNDDALGANIQFGQRTVRFDGLESPDPPGRVPGVDFTATGCAIQVFLPAQAKTITFRYYIGKISPGGAGVWGFVRFDDNPTHDTPISVSTYIDRITALPVPGDATPFEVIGHDISAIADGEFHKMEVFAGALPNSVGDSADYIIRLPSGGPITNIAGGGNLITFDFSELEAINIVTTDMGALETTDAELTVEKLHTETVGAKWYDRDEALRLRPAHVVHPEASTSSPTFEIMLDPAFSLYVPESAGVLRFQIEAKITGGTQGNLIYSMVDQSQNDFINFPVTATSWTILEAEFLNLAKLRGKTPAIRLTGAKTGGGSVEVRIPDYLAANWKAQPIVSRSLHGLQWRPWALEARQVGALMHAGWWRRMSSRDRDLQERQLQPRPLDSIALASNIGQYVPVRDATNSERGSYNWRCYIPHGTTRLYAPIEMVTTGFASMRIKVDLPNHDPFTDNAGAIIDPIDPGIYEPYYPIVPSDWGTFKFLMVHVINNAPTSTWRLLDEDRGRMRFTAEL